MKHSYLLEGVGFKLRPVELSDVGKILELRTNNLRNQYLNRTDPDPLKQIEWLNAYFIREDDYYFAVENNKTNEIEGFISLYAIDNNLKTAEVGRWILNLNSLAASESILLIYKFAFEVLKLNSTYCRTLADNSKVVSFHNSSGARNAGKLHSEFKIDENLKDAVKHVVDEQNWLSVKSNLEKYSLLIASRILR